MYVIAAACGAASITADPVWLRSVLVAAAMIASIAGTGL